MIGGTHRPSVVRALSSRNTSNHRSGDGDIGSDGADEVGPEPQEHAGDHAHHDRHRDEVHDLPHPAGQAQDEHEQPGGEEGADDLGPGEMAERRSDEDRAGDRPEEGQWLAVDPTGHHGEYAVEEEDAEHPRRELGLRQAALGADRQDHRDRAGGREDQADEPVPGVERPQVAKDAARPRKRPRGVLDQRRGCRRSFHRHSQPRSGRDPATLGNVPAASPWQSTQVRPTAPVDQPFADPPPSHSAETCPPACHTPKLRAWSGQR